MSVSLTPSLTPTLAPNFTRRFDMASTSSPPKTPLDFLSPSSSLRKKGPVALSSHAGTLAENDDAAEKRERLLCRVTVQALESPRSSSPKSARRRSGGDGFAVANKSGLTNVQLKDLYSSCIKLSTENKINSKNAFGLHLIDYMQEFLTNMDKDHGITNFQIAGCTLDASAKIYAGRVDSIHAQAYKMLRGLGRAENANEDGEGACGDAEDETETSNKKKKTPKGARTLETNMDNITVDQFDLEFEVDPLFHKMTAAFAAGGIRGLMLNHLHCRDDSFELLLDSNTIPTPTMADLNWGSSPMVDVTGLIDLPRILSPSVQICPHFADFTFTNWDKNAQAVREKETLLHKTSEHAFDMDAPAVFEDPLNDVPDGGFSDNDGGDGMDEGPTTNMTMSATLGFADGQEAQIVLPGQLKAPVSAADRMGNLVMSLATGQSEYSYFNDDILAMWAGPEHWNNIAPFNALRGLNKNKTKRNAAKKTPFSIDFDVTHDFEKLFSEGKASTCLAESTLQRNSSTQNTLPADLRYDDNNLLKLFLKPKLRVSRQSGVEPEFTDDGNGNEWYNYENANDCANYCPDVENDDDDVSGEDLGGSGDFSQEMSQTFFHGDNLVSQPNRVEKIDIGYAKTAKKIDVKKLKKGMWDILVDSSREETDKENMPDCSSIQVQEDDAHEDTFTKPCSFSDLYSKIPSKISSSMSKELSFPIAFVCLLHLANEKNLNLIGHASMDDVTITPGI